MQLTKNPSSYSTFSSKNISDQQLIQKAIQKQISFFNQTIDFQNDNKLPQVFTFTPKLNVIKSKEKNLRKIDIIQGQERKKIKNKEMKGSNSISNGSVFFPVYTTLMDSEFFKKQQIFKQEHVDSIQLGQSPKTFQRKNANQKTTYQRKKLLPLNKFKNQKKMEARNVQVSFLKVEKAPFLYQNLQSFDRNSFTITNTTFNKNKFLISRKSLQASEGSKRLYENPIFTKQYLSKLAKNRSFVPAFDRYYYYDFLWKIAYSNGLKIQFPQAQSILNKKYKAFVGYGNNSNLIKTLLKRRYSWWVLTDKIQQANFIWTQIKVNSIFNQQNNNQTVISEYESQDTLNLKTLQFRKNRKIMNQKSTISWINYLQQNRYIQQKLTSNFDKRTRNFKDTKLLKLQLQKIKIHNHLPRNYLIGNKKALFATMKRYYQALNKNVFEYLPLTFHIKNNLEDPQYFAFLKHYYNKQKQSKNIKNIWIVKPGQFTNRGNGIIVCQTLQQIKSIVKTKIKLDNGNDRTYIVQEYLERPFLYCGRKFDIRHYMLITFVNGHIKGYWCDLGYIRTTSYEYSINNSFSSVHLTNDAVQKNLPDYGRYQRGNKLSYKQFETYLRERHSGKLSFFDTIYPQMKQIAYDSMRASALFLDPERKGHNFQIFGFDFMIDSKFHPWLIEINTNPCLELSSPVLMDVIPQMVENALKIALDSILPPPQIFQQKRARFSNNVLQQNCFQLLFDSAIQQLELHKMLVEQGNQIDINYKQLQKDEEQVYENDGIQLQD